MQSFRSSTFTRALRSSSNFARTTRPFSFTMSSNAQGQGTSHATGDSVVPGEVQEQAPKGLEESLPNTVNAAPSNGQRVQTDCWYRYTIPAAKVARPMLRTMARTRLYPRRSRRLCPKGWSVRCQIAFTILGTRRNRFMTWCRRKQGLYQ